MLLGYSKKNFADFLQLFFSYQNCSLKTRPLKIDSLFYAKNPKRENEKIKKDYLEKMNRNVSYRK